MTNQFQPTPKDKLNLYVLIILIIGGIIILNLDVIDNFLSSF
jgi:hypothetical protein